MNKIKVKAWNGTQMVSWEWIVAMGLVSEVLSESAESRYKPFLFIGRHDKNGQEIYNGDVVRVGRTEHYVGWNDEDGRWWLYWREGTPALPFIKALEPNTEVIGSVLEGGWKV